MSILKVSDSVTLWILLTEAGISIRKTVLRELLLKIHSIDQCQERLSFSQLDITKETYLCTMGMEKEKAPCEVLVTVIYCFYILL